jgi:anthranilate synthase component II
MNLVMIDNYDSFTYNLVQYFGQLQVPVAVFRNDEISTAQVAALRPSHLVISPGPCAPAQAGICIELIRAMAGVCPILGVCLGHQAIGAAFAGEVVRAQKVMHGKTDRIEHDGQGVFVGLPDRYTVARYHSLALQESTLPAQLLVTARASDGEIMGVRHRTLAVEGVQFHPESVASEHGHALLKNFIEMAQHADK